MMTVVELSGVITAKFIPLAPYRLVATLLLLGSTILFALSGSDIVLMTVDIEMQRNGNEATRSFGTIIYFKYDICSKM
jgi:hypothetical protein